MPLEFLQEVCHHPATPRGEGYAAMALKHATTPTGDDYWYRDTGYYQPEGEFIGLSEPYYFPHLVDVSVGQGILSIQLESEILSELAQPTGYYQDVTVAETADLPAEADRRDQPSNEEDEAGMSWFDDLVQQPGVYTGTGERAWVKSPAGVAPPPAAVVRATPTAIFAPTTRPDEDNEMGWITDIYETVDQSLGGILPGGVPWTPSQPLGTSIFTPVPPPALPPGGGGGGALPPAVIPPGAGGIPEGYCVKRIHGQLHLTKIRKRRRKRLATASDIKDLASLSSVLTKAEVKTWIATHS